MWYYLDKSILTKQINENICVVYKTNVIRKMLLRLIKILQYLIYGEKKTILEKNHFQMYVMLSSKLIFLIIWKLPCSYINNI
jgi:hypothetical protein